MSGASIQSGDDAVAVVISRLEVRLALLAKLHELTRRRGQAIVDRRFEALPRLAEAREAVISRLVASASDLESAARSAEGTCSPEALRLVEQASEVVAEIERLDRHDEEVLGSLSEETRSGIESTNLSSRANRAYASGSAPSASSGGGRTA